MKHILLALALLVLVAGCEVVENPGGHAATKERPVVNVPLALRQRNWLGMSGEQVADAFAKLATVADKAGIDGCAINLEFVKDSDRLLSGDMIPTVTFSLKRQERDMEPVPTDVIDVETQP